MKGNCISHPFTGYCFSKGFGILKEGKHRLSFQKLTGSEFDRKKDHTHPSVEKIFFQLIYFRDGFLIQQPPGQSDHALFLR
jgi:hypothetical protein